MKIFCALCSSFASFSPTFNLVFQLLYLFSKLRALPLIMALKKLHLPCDCNILMMSNTLYPTNSLASSSLFHFWALGQLETYLN